MSGEGASAKVECYSGTSFAERPTAFMWEGNRHTIARIASDALTTQEKKFIVVTEDGKRYELIYQVAHDRWEIKEWGNLKS